MKNRLKHFLTGFIEPLPLFLVFLSIGIATSSLLRAQPSQITQAQPSFMDVVPGSKEVWFFAFIGQYIFSAITTGMPEPTQESSPWYIWAYRTFHILAASGTSFFQNKIYWPATPLDEGKRNAE